MTTTPSKSAVIAALVAIAAFSTAAVLFVAGDAALQRLGLLFAVFGLMIPGLVGALRSDQAATQTNGGLDARIQTGVETALKAHRAAERRRP